MRHFIFLIIFLSLIFSCKKNPKETSWTLESERIKNSFLVYHYYYDELQKAHLNGLSSRINAFSSIPIIGRFGDARNAWKQSWLSYQDIRPYFHLNGAIYSPSDIDQKLVDISNFIPSYIDSTFSSPTTGIIMDDLNYPNLNPTLLINLNMPGNGNSTSGYQPLEFLLWGEDDEQTFEGTRVHYEFVDLNPYNTRRRRFLAYSTLLLKINLSVSNSSVNFEKNVRDSDGMLFLSSYFNMLINYIEQDIIARSINKPYLSQNPADEICRFSDYSGVTIHRQITTINDMIFGSNEKIEVKDGYFLGDLIAKIDPEIATLIKSKLTSSSQSFLGLSKQFDEAINYTPDRQRIDLAQNELLSVVEALKKIKTKMKLVP